jgi:ubiquinone/menaquinone biosynthesis C-methylase UbiE
MSFERLAPHYTWMEVVLAGGRLQRCRLAWLETLAGCESILIAGVGHGHFLQRCVQRFPRAHITSVDASAGMLRRARHRTQAAGARMAQLSFIHAALPEWKPPMDTFDAVVTHFFLDCFASKELGAVVRTLSRAARPKARWLISDFAVPAYGVARQRARVIHALMYAFFRRVADVRACAVTDPGALLQTEGFALTGRKSAEWGLLHADCWERTPAA